METAYILNHESRIDRVEGSWNEFASQNDGAEAFAEKVVGHSIWNFTAGFEVQSFLNAVFFFVQRSNAVFETKYRCDGNDTYRLFSMTVSPSDEGGLRVSHKLLQKNKNESPGKLVMLENHRCLNRCSMCCHFKVGNEWIDPFAHPEERFFPKSYTICPSCKGAARKRLGRVVEFRNSHR